MRPRRGTSIIEAMVALAILLMTIHIVGAATDTFLPWSTEVVLRERALQVLEAEARALTAGRSGPDAAVREGLLAELPQGRLTQEPAGAGAVRLTVHWRGANARPSSRTLVVWPRGGAR